MSTIATTQTVRITGTIMLWKMREGWGLIQAANRIYFAHASAFVSECLCGKLHNCEIVSGTEVEFSYVPGVEFEGRYPHAKEIRVRT